MKLSLRNVAKELNISVSYLSDILNGKTRLVSEDIFNEVDTILSKYKEIIGE